MVPQSSLWDGMALGVTGGLWGQEVMDLVGSVLLHPPESCELSEGQFVG